VFVGGTSWFPNRDALEWFTAEVLPALRRLGVDTLVTWVGRCTPQERARGDGIAGLRMTGYVDDIRPYLERAACFIAPLRVGGGTRLKLLDAWAAGKAIVSTRAGAEGLDAVHEGDLLLADSADEFASCVARTLADAALRRRLGTAGRARAERDFSWPHIGARLAAEVQAVCRARAHTERAGPASMGAAP
jgi:glycosyltransferase involved in cell wall biosynthesis